MQKNIKRLGALGLVIPMVLGSTYYGNEKVYAELENNSTVQELRKYNVLSENEVIELKDFFLSNYVTYEKTLELIDKIDSGEFLNSNDEKFSDSKELTFSKTYEDGSSKEIYTYPDGSISVIGVESGKCANGTLR